MKKSEVGELLTAIAATDNRTIGRLDIDTWFAILPENMDLADAHAALIQHRRTSTDWLQPKHIIDGAKEISRQRWEKAGTPPIPDGLTWRQEKDWRQAWCTAIKAAANDPVAVANAVVGIERTELPPNPEMAARVNQLASGRKS